MTRRAATEPSGFFNSKDAASRIAGNDVSRIAGSNTTTYQGRDPDGGRSLRAEEASEGGGISRSGKRRSVISQWSCNVCTFVNSPDLQACAMCETARGDESPASKVVKGGLGNDHFETAQNQEQNRFKTADKRLEERGGEDEIAVPPASFLSDAPSLAVPMIVQAVAVTQSVMAAIQEEQDEVNVGPERVAQVQPEDDKMWSCHACTFRNALGVSACEICETPKGKPQEPLPSARLVETKSLPVAELVREPRLTATAPSRSAKVPPEPTPRPIALKPKAFPRAEFLTVVIVRESTTEKLGLSLKAKGNRLVISKIREDGRFGKTHLMVGDILLQINGRPCHDEDTALDVFRRCTGRLTLAAYHPNGEQGQVETMIEKPVHKTPLGIGLRQNVEDLQVSKAEGLFADTLVEVGDCILAINQVECNDELPLDQVNRLIRKSPQYLTLRTETDATASQLSSKAKIKTPAVPQANITMPKATSPFTLEPDPVTRFESPSPMEMENKPVVESARQPRLPVAVPGGPVEVARDQTPRPVALKPKSFPRAEFITVVIVRESTTEKLGLSLMAKGRRLAISKLREDGRFGKSPLMVGDVLLQINGRPCHDEDSAIDVFRLSTGRLTLVAHNPDGEPGRVETMIEKPIREIPLGIGIRQNVEDLEVSKAEGLFADTLVEVGDCILAINQVECNDELPLDQANRLIRQSRQYMTMRTETEASASLLSSKTKVFSRAEFISVVIVRESTTEKLGLSLKAKGNRLVISKLREDGRFGKSPLQVGDAMLQINGRPCHDEDAAIDVFRRSTGRLTLVAHHPNGVQGQVETMIEKPIRDTPLGIAFRQNVEDLEVSKAEGLFADTLVEVGDCVLAINQVECNDQLPLDQVNRLIRKSKQYLTLRTETQKQ